ncbi:MAG: hypothetical protein HY238_07420 [Acidobacteria bacterium]|nr:hypothetical protein [Acidobacteriota bacterium]
MDNTELESLFRRLAEQQIALTQHVDHFHREISAAVIALAEEQKRLAQEQRRLAEAQTRLTEAQQHTEERLNGLIGVVDGMIRRPPAP